jgi:hypothetical protein
MRSKGEVEEKKGGEENLTAEPSELSRFVVVDHGSWGGAAQESVPFL